MLAVPNNSLFIIIPFVQELELSVIYTTDLSYNFINTEEDEEDED